MTSSPHPFRRELIDRWSAFLDARADEKETAEYVDRRLADYGPEELVHDGLLILNDELRAGRPGGSATTASRNKFDSWKTEAASFDSDPGLWNRNWAIGYLERVLPGIKPARRGKVLKALSEKLSDSDIADIAERFDIA